MAIRQPVKTKVTIVVILLLLVATMFHLTQKPSDGSESQPKMPFLDKRCVKKLTDMQDLIDTIKNNSKSPDCKEAWDSLLRIYDIHISDDKHINIPSEMRESLIKSMKGDENICNRITNPSVLIVTNKWTHETNGWNPLMAKKPSSTKTADTDEKQFTDDLISRTRDSCDFCAKNRTAVPAFGRIENTQLGIYTAANLFPYLDMVGLIIPRNYHDFRKIDWPTFRAIWDDVAVKWYKATHVVDPGLTHPEFTFNAMPQGGATQAHPHVQTFMGRGQYLGHMFALAEAAKNYNSYYGRNYFHDFVLSHMVLGLTVSLDQAAIVTSLTASLDNEFEVIDFPSIAAQEAPRVSQDWVRGFYLAMRTLLEELQTHCFSSGGAWPTLTSSSGGNLAVGRIVGRRPCNQVFSEIGAQQLFTARYLHTNLFENIKALHRVAQRYSIEMHDENI